MTLHALHDQQRSIHLVVVSVWMASGGSAHKVWKPVEAVSLTRQELR